MMNRPNGITAREVVPVASVQRVHRKGNRTRTTAKALLTTLAAGTVTLVAGTSPASAADWTAEPLPPSNATLLAIAPIGPDQLWAAGAEIGSRSTLNPLLLARDGGPGAPWHRLATPADSLPGRINALSAAAPDDVWLVGDDSPTPDGQIGTGVVTEHWNGRAWTVHVAPIPDGMVGGGFQGVATLSPTDAWAVGEAQVSTPDGGASFPPLIEHWNGKHWKRQPVPGAPANVLFNAILAVNSHDIWVGGSTPDTLKPVLLHYDGRCWAPVEMPAIGGTGGINALVPTGDGGVWAAGVQGADTPLLARVVRGRLRPVKVPGAGQINGIAPLADGGVAVVGYDRSNGVPFGRRLTGTGWQSLDLPSLGEAPLAATSSGSSARTAANELDVAGTIGHADGTFDPLVLSRRIGDVFLKPEG